MKNSVYFSLGRLFDFLTGYNLINFPAQWHVHIVEAPEVLFSLWIGADVSVVILIFVLSRCETLQLIALLFTLLQRLWALYAVRKILMLTEHRQC